MFNPKKILVPTDFSECGGSCSMMAVKKAVSLSKQFNSELIFLHVISEDPYRKPLFFLDGQKIDDILEKMKEASREELNKILAAYASDVLDRCKVVIKTGKPSAIIVDEAKKLKVDLIVIAPRGLGQVQAAVFGSTTAKVIRRAICSVLIPRNPYNKQIIK